jgi:hypothetical protein
MAAQLHNDVYDDGLSTIDDNCNALHICSADPGIATYANVATYTLGNKSTPTIGVPEDHTSGRKVVVSSISDGTVTGTDTATHVALVDTVNEKTLVTQALDSSQAVTSGNTFTLTSFYVAIPAPTA